MTEKQYDIANPPVEFFKQYDIACVVYTILIHVGAQPRQLVSDMENRSK
uniref:Uncharacterized protein n=1 Tax=Arundo donax TaxID=35708 RepID=A0A0A9H0C4_ARUDO